MQFSNGSYLKGFLRKLNNRWIIKKNLPVLNAAALNIGVSQKVIDQFSTIEGFHNSGTYVLYNGIDQNKFYKTNTAKNPGLFLIGCVGNFWDIKDQMSLIKAVQLLLRQERIKNCKVLFVGTGSELESCKEFVSENNLTEYFEFIPVIEHDHLNEFYNRLDLFVLPSWYEAFGCVYAEALAVGLPIIAVKNQGIEEVINKEYVDEFFISKSDYLSLADKIEHFYKKMPFNLSFKNLSINKLVGDFLSYIDPLI